MAYTPPNFNQVNFNFTTSGYTPPTKNQVNFNFGATSSGKAGRKQKPSWQIGSRRGNSFKK